MMISIHALLAESDRQPMSASADSVAFLSTLSLRRATTGTTLAKKPQSDFYPRSPCGERPYVFAAGNKAGAISIHALLAESDIPPITFYGKTHTFLSTLSLRRATPAPVPRRPDARISIHALLAESDHRNACCLGRHQISIHALLAESDAHCFDGREPSSISIHALLAESDHIHSTSPGHPCISIHALLAESDNMTRNYIPRMP